LIKKIDDGFKKGEKYKKIDDGFKKGEKYNSQFGRNNNHEITMIVLVVAMIIVFVTRNMVRK